MEEALQSPFPGWLRAFDRFQQRHAALAMPVAVMKKFGKGEDKNLFGFIAFRAFFRSCPLLLLLTTVLGYVLAGGNRTCARRRSTRC